LKNWLAASSISGTLFDYDKNLEERRRIEKEMEDPGFWSAPDKAKERINQACRGPAQVLRRPQDLSRTPACPAGRRNGK